MKKKLFSVLTSLIVLVCMSFVLFSACENPVDNSETNSGDGGDSGGGTPQITFDTATTPGNVVSITVGSETVNMIYANNQTSITFPFSPEMHDPVDDKMASLTRKFFMSETQVTNALMVEVLNWALNNGKFSTTVGEHNSIDSTTVKYGGQQLLKHSGFCMINYSDDTFTVDYEENNLSPVVDISWYGAIMFCNWLTEMRDGDTTNVVYTGIEEAWDASNTVEHADKTGYCLQARNGSMLQGILARQSPPKAILQLTILQEAIMEEMQT